MNPDFDPNYFHNLYHQLQHQRASAGLLFMGGGDAMNPDPKPDFDPNYFHNLHQQLQNDVFLGEHRLNPNPNYYYHQQQEGVSLGDYHINLEPSNYRPYQMQPKHQLHEKPPYFSPISSYQRTSHEFSDYDASCAQIRADGIRRFESGFTFSRPPTVEEMLTYNHEVEESDGFNVTDLPHVFLAGSISPIDISEEYCRNMCETVAQTAIAAFNAKYERSKGELKLEKLVKAMCQGVGGIKYYLTFDATNVAKKSTKAYQAKVLGSVGGNEVTGFRRQGSKKWYWNNSC